MGRPPTWRRRREAFRSLSVLYRDRFARSAAFTESAATSLSDLQFTGRYRVPAPFSAHVRKHLQGGGFVDSGAGVKVTDLDGNKLYDLTGSYGVNVFGTDFYRRCIAEGAARAEALGPFLGALHPLAAENAQRLKAISGLDEVSFHMSGTEAVMQAVRLARYHTGRRHLVRDGARVFRRTPTGALRPYLRRHWRRGWSATELPPPRLDAPYR
jgi:glutamate-1-semialdehyde 2,1-aminomutase